MLPEEPTNMENTPEEPEIHWYNVKDLLAENKALKEENQELRKSVEFLQSQIMANRNKNTSEF